MKNIRILTGAIALASAFGFAGASLAAPPESGVNSEFAVSAPIIDVDGNNVGAKCGDGDDDNQCGGSEAFITKGGFWGVTIQGVVLANVLDELRVCLTGETFAGGFAEPLVSGLVPEGPKDTISAGGDLFADTGFEIVGLPGFGILTCPLGVCDDGESTSCGGGLNILEFETGIRVD